MHEGSFSLLHNYVLPADAASVGFDRIRVPAACGAAPGGTRLPLPCALLALLAPTVPTVLPALSTASLVPVPHFPLFADQTPVPG